LIRGRASNPDASQSVDIDGAPITISFRKAVKT
jgi:hypothetical protein